MEVNNILANINHLKEKSFVDCVNELIKKDVLVFYDQTPYADGPLLTDPTIIVKSGCLLTTSARINSLQLRYDTLSLESKQDKEEIQLLRKQRDDYLFSDDRANLTDLMGEQIRADNAILETRKKVL